jgi:Flp pilus assembly protein TadD
MAPSVRDSCAARQLNEQGLALIEHGDLAGAEEAFRGAIARDLYFGPAHANLGVVLLQQGAQPFEAGWALRHAAQLMPKASAPRANLGLLFEAVGLYGRAEDQLRAALRLSPDDVEVIGHLARVHVRQSKRTPETLAWLEAVATQDDDAAWHNWAARQLTHQGSENLGDGR